MSYLIMLEKCCKFCKVSRSNQDKAMHQKDLLHAASALADDAVRNYEYEIITYEQFLAVVNLSEEVGLICQKCDNSTAKVSDFIISECIIPMKKIIDKERRQFAIQNLKNEKDKHKRMGIVRNGNLLIIKKFQTRKK